MESTLALKYSDLSSEVGSFLGWGHGAAGGDVPWSTFEAARIESCIKSGLRQFYFPPAAEGSKEVYDWSFMHPTAELDFPINTKLINLPDDFGGVEGWLTLKSTSTQVTWEIKFFNENQLRQLYSITPNTQGRPTMAAIVPQKGTTATAAQRFELMLYPATDENYVIQIQYYILPDCLSGASPYAYGGAQHAETILESCLAIAEQRLDDQSSRIPNSTHSLKFAERLAASIAMDRKIKPQQLGYNRDRSDQIGLAPSRMLHGLSSVQYEGRQY